MRRVYRYIKLYGIQRTLAKILGRLRLNFPLWMFLFFPYYFRRGKKIAIIGCGHHAYSSIAFYLSRNTNSKIIGVYDIHKSTAESLAIAYKSKFVPLDTMLTNPSYKPDLVYICTNHATHSELAIKFLEAGCDVFIEKPISVNKKELKNLSDVAQKNNNLKIYAGYNRPFSPAIKKLKKIQSNKEAPFTLSSFIIGHHIEEGHWYRNQKEGTRILSNLSHWIDLYINMLFWNNWKKDYIDISISYSYKGDYFKNFNEPFSISLTNSVGDISTITFSCREEPYEGVNETINFQQGNLIAKIDDFRNIQIWDGKKYKNHKYWPKDNGHKNSINQPFFSEDHRSWDELELSTNLTLYIDEMVKKHENFNRFEC